MKNPVKIKNHAPRLESVHTLSRNGSPPQVSAKGRFLSDNVYYGKSHKSNIINRLQQKSPNNLAYVIVVSALFFLVAPQPLRASVGEELAKRVILGEAEGEPYLGKVAVGEVLRRRGSAKGFFGAKAITFRDGSYFRGTRKIGDVTVGQALKAWRESSSSNVSSRSTHFENVVAFGTPYWASSMIPTVRIGSHQFYREVSK